MADTSYSGPEYLQTMFFQFFGDRNCVTALPTQYSVDFIFLSFEIIDPIVEF